MKNKNERMGKGVKFQHGLLHISELCFCPYGERREGE